MDENIFILKIHVAVQYVPEIEFKTDWRVRHELIVTSGNHSELKKTKVCVCVPLTFIAGFIEKNQLTEWWEAPGFMPVVLAFDKGNLILQGISSPHLLQ